MRTTARTNRRRRPRDARTGRRARARVSTRAPRGRTRASSEFSPRASTEVARHEVSTRRPVVSSVNPHIHTRRRRMRASSSTATATTEASTSASTTSRAVPHLDVLRVSQVDAARLDGELVDVLGNQLTRVVDAARATTRGRATDTKSTREMRLALDLALFACTTGVNRATPGQELMNLRFRDERTTTTSRATLKTGVEGDGLSVAQRLVYGSVKCVAAYAWGSWQRKMLREKFDEEEDASCWRRRVELVSSGRKLLHAGELRQFLRVSAPR